MSTKYGELRFGFTVARLDELARIATKRERWYRALDFTERVSIAFSATVTGLQARDRVAAMVFQPAGQHGT